jgi:hypothetical protein
MFATQKRGQQISFLKSIFSIFVIKSNFFPGYSNGFDTLGTIRAFFTLFFSLYKHIFLFTPLLNCLLNVFYPPHSSLDISVFVVNLDQEKQGPSH